MKQGTISILFGCHSIIHSFCVIGGYVYYFKRIPTIKETICIFIHDIGHFGLNYLDNEQEKRIHWRTGARLGYRLFGKWGYKYIAGHTTYSNFKKSDLFYADKLSWYVAPTWWFMLNNIFEPKLRTGMTIIESAKHFKGQVNKNINNGIIGANHQYYIDRKLEYEKDNK